MNNCIKNNEKLKTKNGNKEKFKEKDKEKTAMEIISTWK